MKQRASYAGQGAIVYLGLAGSVGAKPRFPAAGDDLRIFAKPLLMRRDVARQGGDPAPKIVDLPVFLERHGF